MKSWLSLLRKCQLWLDKSQFINSKCLEAWSGVGQYCGRCCHGAVVSKSYTKSQPFIKHNWKPKVVIMPTLSSLTAQQVVIMSRLSWWQQAGTTASWQLSVFIEAVRDWLKVRQFIGVSVIVGFVSKLGVDIDLVIDDLHHVAVVICCRSIIRETMLT